MAVATGARVNKLTRATRISSISDSQRCRFIEIGMGVESRARARARARALNPQLLPQSGRSVSGAGDVNGDGLDVMPVSPPDGLAEATVYLYRSLSVRYHKPLFGGSYRVCSRDSCHDGS